MKFNKEKMLSQIKEKKVFLVLLTAFWIYIIFVLQCFETKDVNFSRRVTDGQETYWTPELMRGSVLEQDIEAYENNLRNIGVVFGTYARTNIGSLEISITELNSGNVIYNSVIELQKLQDCKNYDMWFETQKESKGKKYRLSIKSLDGAPGNAVSVLGVRDSSIQHMLMDGDIQNASINATATYSRNDAVRTILILSYVVVIVLSYICCIMISKPDEKSFLVISVIIGILMVFANPFFHPIDESTHFFRSFAISEGQLIDVTNENGQIGAILPENYEFGSQLNLKSVVVEQHIFGESFSKDNKFISNPYMSSVLPTNHLVAAIGIFIANLFHAPIFVVVWMSRLSVLLVYIMLCYWAIKNAPRFKSLFFIVALLPMSMWLAASCSQDPIINAAALLFTSLCLKYKFGDDEKISKIDMIAILLCGISIASVKYLVYSPLLLLFFVIPKEKFQNKHRTTMIVLAIMVMVGCLAGQFALLDKFPFEEDRNGDVDVARQIKYILGNIGTTVRNFAQYAVTNLLIHLKSFRYETATQLFSELSCVFGIAVAPILCKDKFSWKESEKKQEKVMTVMMVVIVVIVALLAITALYLGYTPVGKYAVDGLQTRYFIPVLIPIMYLLSKLKVENNIEKYELIVSNLMFLGLLDMVVGLLINVF